MDRQLAARAAELAAAIKETEVYKEWVKAREELEAHQAAQVMLRNLQALQAELMRKAQAGEPISQAEEEHWQRTLETVAFNPYVRAVLETDIALGQLLAGVYQMILTELGVEAAEAAFPAAGQPAAPAPGQGWGPAPGQGPQAAPEPEPPRKSRLWVPGQP
ncbi:MAG TPA: YlbF family regulator [Limnochordales bacterium]